MMLYIPIIGWTILLIVTSTKPILGDDSPVYLDSLSHAIIESEATDKQILVIFTANWCSFCKIMQKDLEGSPEILQNTLICYIDYDNNHELVKEYRVKIIPDYFIIKNKREIKRKFGYSNIHKFKEWLNNE